MTPETFSFWGRDCNHYKSAATTRELKIRLNSPENAREKTCIPQAFLLITNDCPQHFRLRVGWKPALELFWNSVYQ